MINYPNLFYHPAMMQSYHDINFGDMDQLGSKEYKRQSAVFKSWLTTYRWEEIREEFKKKYGYVPECIHNKTYLVSIDDKKSIKQDDTLKQDKIKKVREPKTKKSKK